MAEFLQDRPARKKQEIIRSGVDAVSDLGGSNGHPVCPVAYLGVERVAIRYM